MCYVANESDIKFFAKLNIFLSRLGNQRNSYKFLLFGSCGSTTEDKLGKCYAISKVTKFDRGVYYLCTKKWKDRFFSKGR